MTKAIFILSLFLTTGCSLKPENFNLFSTIRCGLIPKNGDESSPLIAGTEIDYQKFIFKNKINNYSFFKLDITLRSIEISKKEVDKIVSYLKPADVFKNKKPTEPLTEEDLNKIKKALDGPNTPENKLADALSVGEAALNDYKLYSGKCMTIKKGVFDFTSSSQAIINF